MQKRAGLAFVLAGVAGSAAAQVPDLLNALDVGGRAMGAGGAFNVSNADSLSSYNNPAGLGYLERRNLGIAYRNLPKSRSTLSGSFENPDVSSDAQSGGRAITHAGLTLPIRDLLGRGKGSLGFSYTVGGYIGDLRTADTLSSGALQITQYREALKARSEFFTIAYGSTLGNGSLTYGFGLFMVRQRIESSMSGVLRDGNTVIDDIDSEASSTGTGFGAILGLQFTPSKTPNLSFAASLRTPANLSGNDETSDLYSRVPGRLLLGAAYRLDGLRGGQDFLVIGTQAGLYFGGEGRPPFDRSAQTTLGVGVEYSYAGFGFGRFPLRAGYMSIPAGGDGYGSRNAYTYGIGFRPTAGNYSLDLNFATPEGGGSDVALWVSYRF